MARKSRGIPEINAGSMADIAFLLLVFFLVTTTMDVPNGIQVVMPPISEDVEPPDTKQKQREVLEVLINSRDQLLVENKNMPLENLKDETVKHLTNEGRDPNYSTTSTKAIVSLKNARGTSYEIYIGVYNELQAAYNEVRDDYSVKKFGRKFKDLKLDAQVKEVKKKYPQKLSEAEPIDIEGN